MKIYAIYKGDTFLCEGTAKECAKYLGVKAETVRYWNTKTYKKRTEGLTKHGKNRKCKIVILVEEKNNVRR